MTSTPQQAHAAELAHLWHRLATQHIALGCSCTMSGISVTLEDFEHDIADYLWAESERHGQDEVLAFLLAPGPIRTQERAIEHLLARLQHTPLPEAPAAWLLARLDRTITSYARLHGPALEAPLLGGARAWRGSYRD
ncbi:MAG: hypothetical protein RIQ38_960 [Pseudomonadota bacterium]|jgi:hypothetical protein